jgi:SAM-dependent methyltransferase
MPVDFDRTADDYDRYRTTFPARLFTELTARGIGLPGLRVADLGTGTGILARGFAAAGCHVTGVDVAAELLAKAREHGPGVTYRQAPAEDTGLPGGVWDVVSAGQCWHWFDRSAVAAEARRLLVAGGALVVCYRDYRLVPGGVCDAGEALVLAHNPEWELAGARFPRATWAAELAAAGFAEVTPFGFDVDVTFTHDQWRGRMRSSNGVAGSMSPERVVAFDTDLARLLREHHPEPLVVPHEIWGIVAVRPSREH